MEPDRQEVYERIPWETLEKKGGDRQWLVYAVAGAVVLGALAYSFMRSRPTASLPPPETVTAATALATTAPSNVDATPSTVASPLVVAEADLYAVDPERLVDQAASHAEWFSIEFVAYDGSEQSRETLQTLLPRGLPLPEAPDDIQVFVDWARARAVTQAGPTSFEVDVLVRSLVSSGESGFVRQPPLVVSVPVEMGEDGEPLVAGVPGLAVVESTDPIQIELLEVPQEVSSQIETQGEIVGGVRRSDGTWDVVILAEGSDGVRRPALVRP
ncbi:MAG TPA: hypothetical protein VF148_14295 [Acidimicrobiia bacterium]